MPDEDDITTPARPDSVRHAVTTIIGETAGSASLCWEPRPTGIFDSSLAGEFVDAATDKMMSLIASELEVAWGIIANAHDGNWAAAGIDWHTAAIAFRERYHGILDTRTDPLKRIGVPVCILCSRERTAGGGQHPMDVYDYSALQVVAGRPLGWYSGSDGEICPECMTKTMGAARC